MLIERADVLIVCLLKLGLRLRNGKVVGNAGMEALLRFVERFACEIDVRTRRLNELGRGLNIQNGGPDISVNLLGLVG